MNSNINNIQNSLNWNAHMTKIFMNECLLEIEEVENNTKEICGLVSNMELILENVDFEVMRQEL